MLSVHLIGLIFCLPVMLFPLSSAQALPGNMPQPPITPAVFVTEASSIKKQRRGVSGMHTSRRFRAFFGVTPAICCSVWNKLRNQLPTGSEPKHLLWTQFFLRVYSSEHVNSAVASCDEKTFRKWTWTFASLMADMKVIKWDERFSGRGSSVYKASVDGTDVPIYEPTPFQPKWYSHKFRGPGLRYEVGVGIGTGHIVWVYGPFPCGSHPDLKIFRLGMKNCLGPGENIVADGGYNDERCSAGSSNADLKYWSYVRARHEAINKRLKQFNVLKYRFRK